MCYWLVGKKWKYVRFYTDSSGYVFLTESGLFYTKLREIKNVAVDTAGTVTFTDCNIGAKKISSTRRFYFEISKIH